MNILLDTENKSRPIFRNALALGFIGVASLSSPLQAAPTNANGQIFQLVDSLDVRVTVIEAGFARSQQVTVDKHGFQPNSNVYFANDSSYGAFAQGYTPLRTSIHFPDGAVVTKLTCFFYDDDPDNDLACRLGKTELASGISEFIAEVLSEDVVSSDSGDPHIAKALDLGEEETVDNVNYGYFVEVRPDRNDPYDPYDNDEWGFESYQNNTPTNPLTFIKGVRVSYHLNEASE